MNKHNSNVHLHNIDSRNILPEYALYKQQKEEERIQRETRRFIISIIIGIVGAVASVVAATASIIACLS